MSHVSEFLISASVTKPRTALLSLMTASEQREINGSNRQVVVVCVCVCALTVKYIYTKNNFKQLVSIFVHLTVSHSPKTKCFQYTVLLEKKKKKVYFSKAIQWKDVRPRKNTHTKNLFKIPKLVENIIA